MIKCKIISLLLLVYLNCQSQRISNVITGEVRDSIGVVSANTSILLKRMKDSILVKGTFTDNTGHFNFRNVKPDNYFLFITKIGYLEKFSPVFKIDTSSNIKLDDIILEKAVKKLSEVNVIIKKPLIEQKDDKLIYNTESDPLAGAENALDILKKTPMVTVDGEGNITVNGQTSFKVLLNGRETSMFARNVSDALKGFPGKLINRIEIITNPSAKYDAEGVGGLINIITKKKVAGYNGSISSTVATSGFLTENLSLNLKYGNFGVSGYVGLGGNYNQKRTNFQEVEAFYPTVFFKRISSGTSKGTNEWNYGNMELNYDLDSLSSISAYISPSGGDVTSKSFANLQLIRPNKIDTIKSIYLTDFINKYPTYNIGFDYVKKFKSNPDKEFSLKLNTDIGKDNTVNNSIENNPSYVRFIKNNSIAKNKQYTIQSDFLLPLKNDKKVEFGAKSIFRNAQSDYESMFKFQDLDEYKLNPNNSDFFIYKQNVYSIYSSLNFKINKVNFRVGLRAEKTYLNGVFKNSSTTVEQNYTTIIPNLLISKRFTNGGTISLGYNKRIARPYIWNLNPFINNSDSFNISTGNPNLKPQNFNAIQLQYRFNSKIIFYNIGLTYNFSNNQIINYYNYNPSTAITILQPSNLGKSSQTALSLYVSGKLSDAFSFNINTRLQYDQIENNNSINIFLHNSGFSGNGFINGSFLLNKTFDATSYFGFNKSEIELQTNGSLNYYYGLGFKVKLLNEKITVNPAIVNFHEKYFNYKINRFDPNFSSKTQISYPYRAIQIQVSYNFGKLSDNVSRKRGVNNDDLMAK